MSLPLSHSKPHVSPFPTGLFKLAKNEHLVAVGTARRLKQVTRVKIVFRRHTAPVGASRADIEHYVRYVIISGQSRRIYRVPKQRRSIKFHPALGNCSLSSAFFSLAARPQKKRPDGREPAAVGGARPLQVWRERAADRYRRERPTTNNTGHRRCLLCCLSSSR